VKYDAQVTIKVTRADLHKVEAAILGHAGPHPGCSPEARVIQELVALGMLGAFIVFLVQLVIHLVKRRKKQ
jgi:hypothetical protein